MPKKAENLISTASKATRFGGERGNQHNPGGRPVTKPWVEALRKVAEEKHEKDTKLAALARKTFELALNGDKDAAQEIANRLDGKIPQPVTHSGDADNPLTGTLNLVHSFESKI